MARIAVYSLRISRPTYIVPNYIILSLLRFSLDRKLVFALQHATTVDLMLMRLQ